MHMNMHMHNMHNMHCIYTFQYIFLNRHSELCDTLHIDTPMCYIYIGASERYFVWGGYLFIFYILYPIMYY